jgi:hypothetical protein
LRGWAAHAISGITQRIADTTTVMACDGGKLVETLDYASDRDGYSSDKYVLACLRTATEAGWVLIGETTCGGKAACAKVPGVNPKAPYFIANGNDTKPPFRYAFQLVRYGIGRDCRILVQPYMANGQAEIAEAWSCGGVDVHDGTVRPMPNVPGATEGLAPKDYRLFRFQTTGAAAPQDAPEEPLEATGMRRHPPMRFLLPEALYTVQALSPSRPVGFV